jgi:predicted type IV restriction endonuclease
MDLKDLLKQLGEKVTRLKDSIQTEEATKNAFIMPFISYLGYDVFNPTEVVPEYVSDVIAKKGEKVDYAIFKDGAPVILIECKHWQQKPEDHDGQLTRYFNVSKAKFAILTNGIKYRFYTDIDEANKMDLKPFFEFDIVELKDNQIDELKKFHKASFDVQNIVNTASDLKYTNEIKSLFFEQIKSPTPEFIDFFAKKVYKGRITEKIMFKFSELVKKSIQIAFSDTITDRLKLALDKEVAATQDVQNVQNEAAVDKNKESKVETTAEEVEAFAIVKSIIRPKVDSKRIGYKDSQTYFSVRLDENSQRTICRLYFNGNKKLIGLFDEAKKETRLEINSLDDIYKYADRLLTLAEMYSKAKITPEKSTE